MEFIALKMVIDNNYGNPEFTCFCYATSWETGMNRRLSTDYETEIKSQFKIIF